MSTLNNTPILLISEAYVGGVRTHINILLENLIEDGFNIQLLYSGREEAIEQQNSLVADCVTDLTPDLHNSAITKLLFIWRIILASLQWQRNTIVHAHGFVAFLTLALLRSIGLKNTLVVTLHGGILHKEGLIYTLSQWVMGFLAGYVVRFVCVSEHDQQLHLKLHVPSEKLIVIPNAIYIRRIDRAISQQTNPYSSNRINVVVVSTLYPAKGILELLQEFDQTQLLDVAKYKVTLVGTGPLMAQIQALVSNSNYLQKLVEVVGHVASPYHYLKWADIVLFPSRKETFGLVLHEALFVGAKVIAHRQPITLNYLPQAQLVDFDDPDELTRAIETGLNSNPLYQTTYTSSYTEFVQRHKQLYQDLLV